MFVLTSAAGARDRDVPPGSVVEDLEDVDGLDVRGLADAVVGLGVRQRALGARRLLLAVTWADRHVPACRQGPSGSSGPSGEPPWKSRRVLN